MNSEERMNQIAFPTVSDLWIEIHRLRKSEAKAEVLDWLLTSVPSSRADRPDRIERIIDKNPMQALMAFRAWGTPEEILTAIRKEMK